MANSPDSIWNNQDGTGDFGKHPSFKKLANAIAKATSTVRNMAMRLVFDDQLRAC